MVKSTIKMQPNYTKWEKINMTDARRDKPVKLQINNYNPYTKHEENIAMKSCFDGPSLRSIADLDKTSLEEDNYGSHKKRSES